MIHDGLSVEFFCKVSCSGGGLVLINLDLNYHLAQVFTGLSQADSSGRLCEALAKAFRINGF